MAGYVYPHPGPLVLPSTYPMYTRPPATTCIHHARNKNLSAEQYNSLKQDSATIVQATQDVLRMCRANAEEFRQAKTVIHNLALIGNARCIQNGQAGAEDICNAIASLASEIKEQRESMEQLFSGPKHELRESLEQLFSGSKHELREYIREQLREQLQEQRQEQRQEQQQEQQQLLQLLSKICQKRDSPTHTTQVEAKQMTTPGPESASAIMSSHRRKRQEKPIASNTLARSQSRQNKKTERPSASQATVRRSTRQRQRKPQ
jgi:hypothetical protein